MIFVYSVVFRVYSVALRVYSVALRVHQEKTGAGSSFHCFIV